MAESRFVPSPPISNRRVAKWVLDVSLGIISSHWDHKKVMTSMWLKMQLEFNLNLSFTIV